MDWINCEISIALLSLNLVRVWSINAAIRCVIIPTWLRIGEEEGERVKVYLHGLGLERRREKWLKCLESEEKPRLQLSTGGQVGSSTLSEISEIRYFCSVMQTGTKSNQFYIVNLEYLNIFEYLREIFNNPPFADMSEVSGCFSRHNQTFIYKAMEKIHQLFIGI